MPVLLNDYTNWSRLRNATARLILVTRAAGSSLTPSTPCPRQHVVLLRVP